ncbi:hypothetical protein [Pseudomonas sp. Irchel 3E20]|uniref:hypothetical protein n=1 Tax=Pseudomonas sp. Irchel 3E20 TaxID=2008983 RepID=UPI0011406A1A|nr:hypothetical protein [Pseudomonas sp. Irchel 3E20]
MNTENNIPTTPLAVPQDVFPQSNATLPSYFNVKARAESLSAHRWELEFFDLQDSVRFIFDSASPWLSAWIEVPPGEYDYFRIRYFASAGASDWAYMRNIKIIIDKPSVMFPEENEVLEVGTIFYGYAYPGSRISVSMPGGGEVASARTNDEGAWDSTPLPAQYGPGSHELHVAAIYNGQISAWVFRKFKLRPPRLTILDFSSDVYPDQTLVVSGVYQGLATVKIFDGNNREVPGSITGTGAFRTFTPNIPWALGSHSVKAVQIIANLESTPSNIKAFWVRIPKPHIFSPAEEGTVNLLPVFSGNNGWAGLGSRVSVQQEGGHEWANAVPLSSGNWMTQPLPADFIAGTHTLYVRIDKGAEHSDYVVRTFHIRPPRLVLSTPECSCLPGLTLNLTGLYLDGNDLTLAVFDNYGKEIPGSFSGGGTTRIFTPAVPWPIGENIVYATQVSGGVSSLPSDPITFFIIIPSPEVLTPGEEGIVDLGSIFSGRNAYVAAMSRVSIRNSTNHVEQAWATPLVDGRWTSTPLSLASNPGQYIVYVVVEVGTQSSAKVFRRFSVRPPKPVIIAPSAPVFPEQTLVITGVYTGQVSLKVFTSAGIEILGSFTGASGSRTFTPSTAWLPGSNAVKVVQSVAGVESLPSDVRTFIVSIAAPEILEPLEDGVVDIGSSFSGRKGYAGVGSKVTLQESGGYERATAEAALDGSWTSTPLPSSLVPGSYTLYVRVDKAGMPSSAYVARSFRIRPPKLTITALESVILPDSSLQVAGVFAGSTELKVLKEQDVVVPGDFLGSGAVRTFKPELPWAQGENRVQAVQVSGGVESLASDECVFQVDGRTPVIQVPAENEVVDMESPVSGTDGVPGYKVVLYLEGNPDQWRNTTADQWGGWEIPSLRLGAGEFGISVRNILGDLELPLSPVRYFKFRPLVPQITFPEQGAGVELGAAVAGVRGHPGGKVAVKDARNNLTLREAVVNQDGTWSTSSLNFDAGEYEVQALSIYNGIESALSNSLGFSIKPAAPNIIAPTGDVTPDVILEISGVHAFASRLEMFDSENVPVPGVFTVEGAIRKFTPLTPWAEGEHRVKVVQVVNTVTSDPSELCTFLVKAKISPPVIVFPVRGGESSSSPEIKGSHAHPYADVHVRHVETKDQLFHGPADADGNWSFVVTDHFPLGHHALETMQLDRGSTSEWSAPHPFEVVRTAVGLPDINRPRPNQNIYPVFVQGRGTPQATVNLRLKQAGVLVASSSVRVSTSQSWSWAPGAGLLPGSYTVEGQQVYGANESGWTVPAVSFNLVAPTIRFAEAAPVIGHPVVENGEWVLLRTRVVDTLTSQPVVGQPVDWREDNDQPLGTTVTDQDGWASYRYVPVNAESHWVVATITHPDNPLTRFVQPFEIHPDQRNPWLREFTLYLNDEPVDFAAEGVVLRSGRSYQLKLVVRPGSPLIEQTTVALEDEQNAELLGIEASPALGSELLITAQPLVWSVAVEGVESGYFGLKISSPKLPDWVLPGRVIGTNLAGDVALVLDEVIALKFGSTGYPCHGVEHRLMLHPTTGSALLGQTVILHWSGESEQALGIALLPRPGQAFVLGEEGITWQLDCRNSIKDGVFSLRLEVPQLGISSAELQMELGHNKVYVSKHTGPTQVNPPWGYWVIGIEVRSFFTKQLAAGARIKVTREGQPPTYERANAQGQVSVSYPQGSSAELSPDNRYDGKYEEP